MSAEPLKHFGPTNEELLHLVFKQVDDSMLREIAEADYGMDADAHLKALSAIKTGNVPAPMEWEPKEVLELVRWSEPEDPTWKPGSVGARGHWMRLFSCAVLVRAAAEPENDGYFTGEDSTIIQLVDSAIKLGAHTSLAALKFLCWRMQYRTLDEWDRPYFAIAILLLSVSLGKCDPQTAQFLISSASSDEVALSELFGQCQKAQTWNDVTRRILIESTAPNNDLQQFGNALVGGTNAAEP
jgi:hypothetical protein